MKRELETFLHESGWHQAKREKLAGDASAREYTRLIRPDGQTALLMRLPVSDPAQFQRFERISGWLLSLGLSAPRIYHADGAIGMMLIEDFGDGLVSCLAEQSAADERQLYRAASQILIHLAQASPMEDLARITGELFTDMLAPCFDQMSDRTRARELQSEAESVAPMAFDRAYAASRYCVALRDFHAGNLLSLPGRKGLAALGIIDFQDAFLAPLGYDLASLVDDVRREVPASLRDQLVSDYAVGVGIEPETIAAQINLLSLQRNLRILGVLRSLGGRYLAFLPRCRALVAQAAASVQEPDLSHLAEGILGAYCDERVT